MSDDDYKSSLVDYSKSRLPRILRHDTLHVGEFILLCFNLDPLTSRFHCHFPCPDEFYRSSLKEFNFCEWFGDGVYKQYLDGRFCECFQYYKHNAEYDQHLPKEVMELFDLHQRSVEPRDQQSILSEGKDGAEQLFRMWRSGHQESSDIQKLNYFINWAQEKGIAIPWLSWASAEDFRLLGQKKNDSASKAPKIIRAAAEAMIGELTGTPSKDANAFLAALAEKGIEEPCSAETLAKYLKE